MRRSSMGRAQWREDAVDHESALVPSHRSNRVTPDPLQEARPVSWKYGRSVSPSFSTSWLKSTKDQPQIFCAQASSAQRNCLAWFLELFRAFLRVYPLFLNEVRNSRKNNRLQKLSEPKQPVGGNG